MGDTDARRAENMKTLTSELRERQKRAGTKPAIDIKNLRVSADSLNDARYKEITHNGQCMSKKKVDAYIDELIKRCPNPVPDSDM